MSSQGLDKRELSDKERTQLMGIAMRLAIFWGVAVMAVWYAVWFYSPDDEPVWWGAVLGLAAACLAFFYKRRSMLQRADQIWANRSD